MQPAIALGISAPKLESAHAMMIATKKAAQLRILAAQCRGWAEETANPDYAAKMWRAAAELEGEARRMEAEARPQFSVLTAHHPNIQVA